MQEEIAVGAFVSGFEALLRKVPAGLLRQRHVVKIPSDRKPRIDTGIDLAAGETVTTFGAGTTFLTGTNLSFGADFQLWCRVGPEGEIFRGTRASNTFTVAAPGRLYVASYFPGEWATRIGELATPDEVYGAVTGELALRWEGIRWKA